MFDATLWQGNEPFLFVRPA